MTNVEFNDLVYAASKTLRYSALKFANNNRDADVLLTHTIQKALKQRRNFVEGTNIKAWLYLIMKNNFEKGFIESIKKSELDTSCEPSPVESKCLQYVNDSVNTLDKIFREPFVMHFSGFRIEEIAESLRLPIGTVKNRIHVARKILKSHYPAPLM